MSLASALASRQRRQGDDERERTSSSALMHDRRRCSWTLDRDFPTLLSTTRPGLVHQDDRERSARRDNIQYAQLEHATCIEQRCIHHTTLTLQHWRTFAQYRSRRRDRLDRSSFQLWAPACLGVVDVRERYPFSTVRCHGRYTRVRRRADGSTL